MLFGLHWGSHFKNQKELAEWLMNETHEDGSPVYDLSMLVWGNESRVKESENFHLIRHPEDCPMTDAQLSEVRTIEDIVNMTVKF